jgi:hypothetical protein
LRDFALCALRDARQRFVETCQKARMAGSQLFTGPVAQEG